MGHSEWTQDPANKNARNYMCRTCVGSSERHRGRGSIDENPRGARNEVEDGGDFLDTRLNLI